MQAFGNGGARRVLSRAACALALTMNQVSPYAAGKDDPEVTGPTVRGAVAPKTSAPPKEQLTPAPQWKPGDPVRVRPDLKSSTEPKVSEPVKPKVREGSLQDEPVLRPPPPDAPPRVRPDLRETPSRPEPDQKDEKTKKR